MPVSTPVRVLARAGVGLTAEGVGDVVGAAGMADVATFRGAAGNGQVTFRGAAADSPP